MQSYFWLLLLLLPVLLAGCEKAPVSTSEGSAEPGNNSDSIVDEVLYPAHLDTALSYIGTTDRGDNTGPDVDRFLASTNLNPGYAWCAAFVSYCLTGAVPSVASPQVRSALARDFKVPGAHISASHVLRTGKELSPGTIVGWQRGNGPYGHLGLVKQWKGASGTTVEGNTTAPGKQGSEFNGGGVWVKQRDIVPSNHFRITWFTKVEYE